MNKRQNGHYSITSIFYGITKFELSLCIKWPIRTKERSQKNHTNFSFIFDFCNSGEAEVGLLWLASLPTLV